MRGVPVVTTLSMLGVLVVGVALNWALPDEVFTIVASLATFATVFVWLMILLAQVASRRGMSRAECEALEFPVPFWPYGQVFAIAFILFTLGIMVWQSEYHMALAVGAGFTVLMSALYLATVRRRAVRD
jgi:AAT family amino acid transporter